MLRDNVDARQCSYFELGLPVGTVAFKRRTKKRMKVDCKTVGFFFLKIRNRGVRVLREQSARACFQPRSRPFNGLLART